MSDLEAEVNALRERITKLEAREANLMALAAYTHLALKLLPHRIAELNADRFVRNIDKSDEFLEKYLQNEQEQ